MTRKEHLDRVYQQLKQHYFLYDLSRNQYGIFVSVYDIGDLLDIFNPIERSLLDIEFRGFRYNQPYRYKIASRLKQ